MDERFGDGKREPRDSFHLKVFDLNKIEPNARGTMLD